MPLLEEFPFTGPFHTLSGKDTHWFWFVQISYPLSKHGYNHSTLSFPECSCGSMNCMCRLPHPPPLSSHIWKHPWHSIALVSTPPLHFLIALDSGSLCRPNLVTPWRLADSREVLPICQLPLQSIIYLEIKKSRSITEIWTVPCCAPHSSPATGHLYLLIIHNPSSSCPHPHPMSSAGDFCLLSN